MKEYSTGQQRAGADGASTVKTHISKLLAFVFFAALLAVGALFYLLPNKPTFSEKENRDLAEHPEFSVQALLDGSFMTEYEIYFADNFPLRERLVDIANGIRKFGAAVEEDEVQIITVEPTQEAAEDTGKIVEEVPEDEIPDVAFEDGEKRGTAYIISGDTVLPLAYQVEKTAKFYCTVVNDFAAEYPDLNIYCAAPPTSAAFYIPEKYLIVENNQQLMLDNLKSWLSEDVTWVDIYTGLRAHADEYIYFRTDHHWTALGAYYAYCEFIKTAFGEEAEITPLSEFDVLEYPDFLGTLYSQTGGNAAMTDNPDTVYGYDLDTYLGEELEVQFWTNTSGSKYLDGELILDPEELKSFLDQLGAKNYYLAFIKGDRAVTKITTGNTNGRRLLVFKDSFGNAFAPFLALNYEEIYVMDPRYNTPNMSKFIADNGITDVLFFSCLQNTSIYDRVKELRSTLKN